MNVDKHTRKILETGIYEDTRTVDLMDRFEGFGKDVAYQQLVLRNIVCLNLNGKYEYISLVVERSKDHRYIGNITFTELKQGQTKDLYSFLRNQISGEIAIEYKNSDEEIRFSTPYLFRAQNSKNRSGYGWGYGGTQYGETTAYIFAGAFIGYRSAGFAEKINKSIEDADLSEFTLKNKAENPSIIEYKAKEVVFELDEDVVELLDEDSTEEVSDLQEKEREIDDFVYEKRNIPDSELRPEWYYAGFTPQTNLFILALEQCVYLPPYIDYCEKQMITDENLEDSTEQRLTDMEKTFMFFEMLANQIGYSGSSVLALDGIHKRKILEKVLITNSENVFYGEYGDNTISLHLIAEFLENQPELSYRGYVELILSKYFNEKNETVYDIYGGFRDFGENEVTSNDRHYWIGKSRYLLDETGNGSYLQGFYEMLKDKME